MSEGIFMSDRNPISERWVIFEDDEISGWLYLTNPNDTKTVVDCWIYNRIEAPDPSEISNFRKNGSPPPASTKYAGSNAFVLEPDKTKISFKWSSNGNAVALIIDGKPLGYVVEGNQRGYSKNLLAAGPWGNVFEEEKYQEIFSNEKNSEQPM